MTPMEELDLTYYGVRIHLVAAAETTLCSRLRETIPLEDPMPAGSEPASVSYTVTAGASLDTEEQSGYIICRDGREVVSKATEEEVMEWLWQDIDCTIAVHNRRLLFVQAGVVGWHGVAIVIPGPRQAAKSALVAELVRRGAVYFSDTFAVLDETGQVHAYARPLLLESEHRQTSDLWLARGQAPTEPVSIGLIVAGAYQPGCTWRPAIVQGARALWSLFEHTVPLEAQAQWAQRTPTEYLIHIAGRVVPTVVTLQGPWAQVEDIAARLLNLVDDSLVSHASAASSNGTRSLSEDLARVAELRVGTVSPQPVPASRPGLVAKRLVAIVTPIHRLPLSADETILARLKIISGRSTRLISWMVFVFPGPGRRWHLRLKRNRGTAFMRMPAGCPSAAIAGRGLAGISGNPIC
jgi:hypothetical protein